MNHFLKYSFSFFFACLACSACDDDGIGHIGYRDSEGAILYQPEHQLFS